MSRLEAHCAVVCRSDSLLISDSRSIVEILEDHSPRNGRLSNLLVQVDQSVGQQRHPIR